MPNDIQKKKDKADKTVQQGFSYFVCLWYTNNITLFAWLKGKEVKASTNLPF